MFARSKALHHFKLYFPLSLDKIQNCLKHMQALNYNNTSAICVSFGGLSQSPENCQLLHSSLLEARSSLRRLSVYSFLQDKATSLAYFAASAGQTITANPYALIGDVGTAQKSYRNIKKLLEWLGVRYEQLGSKQESTRIWSQFLEQTEREKRITQKWLQSVEKTMIDSVHERRGIQKEQVRAIKNRLYHPQEALSLGLIDAVSTFQQFSELNYPNDSVEDHLYTADAPLVGQILTEKELSALNNFFQVVQLPQVALFSSSDPLQESLKQLLQLVELRLMSGDGLESLQTLLGGLLEQVERRESGQLMFEL